MPARSDEMTSQPEIILTEHGAAAAPDSTPSAAGEARRATFAGLRWTCRPEAEALLAQTPAEHWCDPGAHGWQRVKNHAQREVWRAHLLGGEYFLKYSFNRGWAADLKAWLRGSPARREWQGGCVALRRGLAAVRPVAYCDALRRDGRRCCLLVTPAVTPSLPLHEFWRHLSADPDPRRRRADARRLIDDLACLVARAHQAGFAHLDMHAANLLVQTVGPRRYRPLFVDLQSARLERPLADEDIVRNLAQLNQWFRRSSTIGDRLRFLRAYLRWRNEFELVLPHGRALELDFPQLVAALGRRAAAHARGLHVRRDGRCTGDRRYFVRLRLPGGWRGVARLSTRRATESARKGEPRWSREVWLSQLAKPLSLLAREGETHKDSHSAQVARAVLRCDGATVPVFIKRPRSRSLRRRMRNALAPSRSWRAWRIGNALLNRDLPAVRPLAVLERRVGPLVQDSLLVTEAVPGGIDLESLLRREFERRLPREWFRLKRQVVALVARQLRALHAAGFAHRDCKASNLLVAPTAPLHVLWIDWDGLRLRRSVRPADELRALERLHASVTAIRGVHRTDRARFLRNYASSFGASPNDWRELWRAIAAASERRAAARRRRRAWKLDHYGRE